MPFPLRRGNAVLELEPELMKIIARPRPTSESGDVTTIDKPTDEMRGYILDKFLVYWGFRYRFQMSAATSSFDLDQRIILAFIPRMQQRLCESAHASDRKQLTETSLTIVECTGVLLHNLAQENSHITPYVLDVFYSLLSSEAFVIVSPDLQPLAQKIFTIIDNYQSRMKLILPDMQFYSVAYQCFLHSLSGGGERSENNVMPHTAVGRLISSSLNLPPASSVQDSVSEVHKAPLYPLQYSFFSIGGLFRIMLFLIKEHNESILYDWARHPAMQNVWPACLSRLVRWANVPLRDLGDSEQFRQWILLKRVLAVVVIGELQNILGRSDDDNESLPQYDYDAYTDIDQLPWLREVAGSSSDGEPNALKYSQIVAHPNFQEFLYCRRPTPENVDVVPPAGLT
ncbi:uncharacterized protein ARMOST_15950 [Armillaria ostoyae]|uniref:Uncharacterized protein n=1 Tax=Armillaria ostoyae TaxID=47428 RepID=A0A284RUU1_ARMOS|nr:uncharacterized protein ARMOST_15950 [Armillaria ostoyae]